MTTYVIEWHVTAQPYSTYVKVGSVDVRRLVRPHPSGDPYRSHTSDVLVAQWSELLAYAERQAAVSTKHPLPYLLEPVQTQPSS